MLLVSSVVPVGAVASTSAASTSSTASNDPDCLYEELGADEYLFFADCSGADGEGYNSTAHTLETHTDMYTHLDAQEAASENYLTVVSNYREDLDGRAWMIAEAEVAESYENGSTATEAKANARQAVGQYYEVKQFNLGDRWNTTILAMDYAYERAQDNNVSNLYHHNVRGDASDGSHVNWQGVDNVEYAGYTHATINTSNAGKTQTVIAPQFNVTYTYDNTNSVGTTTTTETMTITPDDRTQSWSWGQLEYVHTSVNPPTSDYPEFVYLFHDHWKQPYVGITEQENTTQNEISQFVDVTYSDFDTGALNASDIVSRITMMEEYGLRGTDENATFSDVTAALASMGLEHPNLAETGYMNVSYTAEDGRTYYQHQKGMLFARNIPSDSWDANGTQYNSTNVSGPVMFANQDGTLITINGTFTIHSATDKNGNTVETVTTEDVDYKVSNTTELQELMNRSLSLQENLTVHTSNGGGGGSGESQESTFPVEVIAALAAAAVLLILIRG